MSLQAGVPLRVLFETVDRAASALPDRVREFVDRLAALNLHSTVSKGTVFHHGFVQLDPTAGGSVGEPIDLGFGKLTIPGLATGVPFQLALIRAEPGGTTPEHVEPVPTAWRLDLVLDVFDLVLHGLQPALFVAESSTVPRHLIPDPNRSQVRISGHATLRLEKPSPDAEVTARFIDRPDPLDPLSASGFIASVNFSPSHFFIGNSRFGMSVGRILYDFSDVYTPPEVMERGQPASWVGLLIRECTVYAPRNVPVLGDISGGVKDLIIGQPLGLQGTLEVQFGRTPLDPATFQFKQAGLDGDPSLTVEGSGRERIVKITGGQENAVKIHAGLTAAGPPGEPEEGLQEWTALWRWPDGQMDEADTSGGRVRHGQTLRVLPLEEGTQNGDTITHRHPEVSFRFASVGTAPTVDVAIGSSSFTNVVYLGGKRADLSIVELTAVDNGGGGDFEWRIEGQPERTAGDTLSLALGELTGEQILVLTQSADMKDKRTARVKISILEEGELLVGCEDGVFEAGDDATPLPLSAVENTFDLTVFHTEGKLETTLAQASLTENSPFVEVPADGLALVTLGAEPADVKRDRRVEIYMDFDMPKPDAQGEVITSWGPRVPNLIAPESGFTQQQLLSWAARYPGARFLVVGRCGDLGPQAYNQALAERRAHYVEDLLTQWSGGEGLSGVDAGHVFARGEQSPWPAPLGSGPENDPKQLENDPEIDLTEDEKSTALPPPENGWLIKQRPDYNSNDTNVWPTVRTPGHHSETIRKQYRRVDVVAVSGAPTDETILPTDAATLAPELRRAYVPAGGREPVAAPVGTPGKDYRVKLLFTWDSPTVSGWADAIPTRAEGELVWTPNELPLPKAGGKEVELSRATMKVHGQWLHDPRSGYTKIAAGVESDGDPDGLFKVENGSLIAALALGPALLSGVDFDEDMVGSGARISALLAAAGAVAVPLPPDNDPLLSEESKAVVVGLGIETEMAAITSIGSNEQYRVIFDYVCELHIAAGVLGLSTDPDRPVKIRYKRVGLQWDTSKSGWEQVGLAYDTKTLEIEDPGKWQIDGVLGELLRITEVNMGRGTFWIEGTIAFGLSLGVVEISEATIRLTWVDGTPKPKFELRGFKAALDIPATIQGEGRLRIEDGGVIRAGVECMVIPPQIGASAAIAFARKTDPEPYMFLSLHVGVQFATPLPLGQSGMAIYGLKGMFAMNGQRALPPSPDPIARELAWFASDPEAKYDPKLGQYALGVGAVVGTMPDVSFCFSCEGMIAVGFPDIEVIFGVKVKIIRVPDLVVKDQSSETAEITGLIVIDDEAVKVGILADYEIPKVVKIKVPFSAYFPYPNSPGDVYVRIGSDGIEGRHGEPITVTLLPGTIDAKAWSYLMIEQGGLPSLGGDSRFSFDGFSVGFGAGWGIEWSAGPIKLSASAKVLVGFGTDPLIIKGGVFVAGELSLVVVSIAARGELILTIREPFPGESDVHVRLDGKFCGKVSLFFFSLEGCVGISIGSDLMPDPPKPKSPVAGISLTDRMDRIMGEATSGDPQAHPLSPPIEFDEDDPDAVPHQSPPPPNHTVWPDTAPIIHFRHFVENAMPGSGQFHPGDTPTQSQWFGSSELKYAYRLDGITLKKKDGPKVEGELQSVWMSSPYRQAGSDGDVTPSEHEGPNLKLLDWKPWNWTLNLDDGGAGQPGDPVKTVEDLCERKPVPVPLCLFGKNARQAGLYGVRIYAPPEVDGPYASRFNVSGEPVLRHGASVYRGEELRVLLGTLGATVLPGSISALPFAVPHNGESITRGYRLPRARMIQSEGVVEASIPYEGRFSRHVARPALRLMVCDTGVRPEEGPPLEERKCDRFEGVTRRGQGYTKFERPGFVLTPMAPGEQIAIVDAVDQRQPPARPGADGDHEPVIPRGGLRLRLRVPADEVEVHVMLFAGEPIKGEAADGRGRFQDAASTPHKPRVPYVLRFSGHAIQEIHLFGGAGEAVVFRVCTDRDAPVKQCEQFSDLPARGDVGPRLEHANITFSTVHMRTETLVLVDEVDQSTATAAPGSDGSAEIRLPDSGMIIDLPKGCDAVEVHLMLFAGPVRGHAVDEFGESLGTDATGPEQHVPQVLHFQGGIRRIMLEGGSSEAVIYRICCSSKPDTDTSRPSLTHLMAAHAHTTADALRLGMPIVTGETIEGEEVPWPGDLEQEKRDEQGICRVITFRPRAGQGPWKGFRIATPAGKVVSLISVCGIEQRVRNDRQSDVAAQEHTLDILSGMTVVGGTLADERRPIFLEANEEYELVIDWSWQAWQPDEPGEEPPDIPDPDEWKAVSEAKSYRFATAALPTEPLGDQQDGLNEYVFDVRDLSRYLVGTEPSGVRAAHFTDDPLWAHFSAGHVEQLAEKYGYTLGIEIRSTDPPPESGVDLEELTAAIPYTLVWRDQARHLLKTGYRRINEAVDQSPCIPGRGPLGGASAEIHVDLAPDASYDMIIAATSDSGSNGAMIEVAREHFRTSRYSGPSAMLAAMGYDVGEQAPSPPDDYILPEGVELPANGGLQISDGALDATLAEIGLDTLPPPGHAPRNLLLWTMTGDAWHVAGLLVDSLEPLYREVTVKDADGVPELAVRFELTHAEIASGGVLVPKWANVARTRMLLVPEDSPSLAPGTETTLNLVVATPEGTLTAGRRITAKPSILSREGL